MNASTIGLGLGSLVLAADPATDLGRWGLLFAIIGGAIRVGTPFLFVSLGECITEKSGRVNLGLEGTLVMGAMTGYAISYQTGSPWIGVLAAAVAGMLLGVLHAVICNLPRVNYVAVGISMMLFGMGLAFYLGKPYIQPSAPRLAGWRRIRLAGSARSARWPASGPPTISATRAAASARTWTASWPPAALTWAAGGSPCWRTRGCSATSSTR